MSPASAHKHDPFLAGTAVFVMLWSVARACVQSISIDEADTYLYAVLRGPGPSHWTPSANNHVLNSMLMHLITTIFGASPLTIRMPALIGAAFYIAAAYCLVRLISERRLLRWATFVCLTASPFVMDYLVAGRGYSLASAFLLWMVTLGAIHHARDPKERTLRLRTTCALISSCGALSIAANFSFAIADLFAGLALFLWIALEQRRDYLKILAWFTLPGLAVGYLLVGSVVLNWPKDQFTWGATSLWIMTKSLVSASLYQPNEYLLHPKLRHYFVHFGTFLYPLLAAFVLWRATILIWKRRPSHLAMICGTALVLALALHALLHTLFGMKLPLDRTAMWVVVLFFVMAGELAVPAGISGRALTTILVLIACYNLGCLRLTYFNEWQYDAAMKDVYTLLSRYHHTLGLNRVSANWRYVAALNCYRAISGDETFDKIPGAPSVVNDYPPDYQAYVVFYFSDQDFLQKQELKLVYRDPFSGVAVAIRREISSGK